MPYTKIIIGSNKADLHEVLRVAVGHMAVNPKDIEKSYLRYYVAAAQSFSSRESLI